MHPGFTAARSFRVQQCARQLLLSFHQGRCSQVLGSRGIHESQAGSSWHEGHRSNDGGSWSKFAKYTGGAAVLLGSAGWLTLAVP